MCSNLSWLSVVIKLFRVPQLPQLCVIMLSGTEFISQSLTHKHQLLRDGAFTVVVLLRARAFSSVWCHDSVTRLSHVVLYQDNSARVNTI